MGKHPTTPLESGLVAELSHVTVPGTGGVPRLADVSLTVQRGERLLVSGVSGSGKSTLLGVLGSLVTPTEGQVRLFGQDISQMRKKDRDRLVREHVGAVAQEDDLQEGRSVLDNLNTAFDLNRRGRAPVERIADLTLQLGIAGRAGEIGEMLLRRPDTLSGGQRQRVAIGRALLPHPQLLLLDEPTAALNEKGEFNKTHTLGIISDWAARTGSTVVMVSHDGEARQFVTREVTMRDGQITDPSSNVRHFPLHRRAV